MVRATDLGGRPVWASRGLVASRAGQMALGALAALALLVMPAARAQAAESKVTVGPAEVSAALFVAGDVSRLAKIPAGTEDVVLEKALQQLYADEPTLTPATAEGYIDDMKAALAASSAPSQATLQLMAGNQRIIAILATLERPSGSPASELPAAAKLAVTHLAAVALSGSSDIFAAAETPKYFEPLADARTNLPYTSFAPASVLRATRELAQTNRTFGEARDALWKTASEESVFSGWKELLEESKVLRSEGLKEVREAVEKGAGTIIEEPTQLTALFTAGQKSTQEQSCEHIAGKEEAIGGNSIPGVPQLKCSGGALYEDAHATSKCGTKTECEKALAELQSSAAKQATVIAQERAAMVAAGELLRPSDNTAASLQQATAQAQAQITEEETAYATYEAEQAQKAAIAGGVKSGLLAGTGVLAIATGNESEGIAGLIGVGFEVYEHTEKGLSNPPPGPQEITLQDLADISTQLAGFQQYTQEAFHALNTQVAQLSAQLARENYELKEQLGELGERLVKEQGTIYTLQDEVQTLFATQTKANLQTSIEDSVGWLKRTGEPLSGPKIQEALVALKKFATEIANGALVNNAETQPYTFEGADRQLTSKVTGEPAELSEDLSYLGHFPIEQGWVNTLAPPSLANTTFWAESSRAYAQLMLENASHATAADLAGLKELEKEGLTLEKAQGAWSEHSATSPGSPTGNTILDQAIANFENAAHAPGVGVDSTSSVQALLNEAAEKSLEGSLKTVSTGSPLANPTNVGLWGGAEQSFSASTVASAKYPALKWEECSGSAGKNGKQEMPESFIASLPATLVNGVRLGVIGAPGSGDPLILEACRTITQKLSTKTTLEASNNKYEINCPNEEGVLINPKDCKLVYKAEATQEKEAETVTETLTLTEGEGGGTLASPSVGECKQTALFWTGKGEDESRDPEDEELNGDDYSRSTFGGTFEKRHVGTIESLEFVNNGGISVFENTNELPAIEHPACSFEGAKEAAGVEYAKYGENVTSPLGSVEPSIVGKVNQKLRELQEGAYGAGLSALKNPPKGNPAESLAGARALVQSYIKLGFPQALASNTELQSDIEGLGAQFLDPEPITPPRSLPVQLEYLIGSWVTRLKEAGKSGQPALSQVIGEELIKEVATRSSKWATEVAEQIKPYVEGKVSGFGTGTEAVSQQSALVESTLNRVQLTRDVLAEAKAPAAETLTPGSVGTSEATVRGEVDPNGGVVESCAFEYGATEFYGHSIPCSVVPSATEKAVVVSAKIANWTPEGSFHERVVLKTWGGSSYGEDVKVQLAQSTPAPSGGLVIGSTDTTGATIGTFKAEELPAGTELPAGLKEIIGSLKFTVNVTPGGSARVKIELPAGSAPSALYKLVHVAGGGEEYKEIPTSLYTIKGNVIELTLVDGGPDDEDGEVNGVIVDPLVPVIGTKQSLPNTTSTTSTATTTTSQATTSAHKTHTSSECVSHRQVTVHVADHLSLPAKAKLLSSEILLRGRVVAKLSGRAKAAVVSFAGLHKGPYKITLVATLSNGEKLSHTIVFHTCSAVPKPGH